MINLKPTLSKNAVRDISLELLDNYENKVVWNLNTLCNYRCPYCFFPAEVLEKEHESVGKYSIEHIAKSFDDTKRQWLILISGGEPFLYKPFVSLAKELTKNHHIQLTTNMSRPGVYEFADKISPDRVMIVSASLHMIDIEKRGEKALQDFIDKCLYLQERNFLVMVNYVTYPPHFSRIEDDFKYLKAAGVKSVSALTFRGRYEGKLYPEAYSEEQLSLIEKLAIDKRLETAISRKGLYFKGELCDAGYRYFQMSPDGTLSRCCSISENHGNLFEGTAKFNEKAKPCTVGLCQDACLGVSSVHCDF